MTTLYKYFFCKAYYFCIKVFKEREFPWFFASGAISMQFFINSIVLWELIQYIIQPSPFKIIREYYGYLSLGGLITTAIYVKNNDRYLNFLNDFKELTIRKKRVLGYISIIYILCLISGLIIAVSISRE